MPYEIKDPKGLSARSYPKAILDRPKLAMLIGAISATWGEMDESIKRIFSFASFAKRGADGWYRSSELADIVYGSVEGLGAKTRHRLVQDVIDSTLTSDIGQELKDICKRYERLSRERNELVHSHFQLSDEYPDDLLVVGEKWIRFTEADLLDRLNRHVELRNTVHDFLVRVSNAPRKEID